MEYWLVKTRKHSDDESYRRGEADLTSSMKVSKSFRTSSKNNNKLWY